MNLFLSSDTYDTFYITVNKNTLSMFCLVNPILYMNFQDPKQLQDWLLKQQNF